MKILVTGGAGRIGKITVGRLVEHGHSVHAIDLAPEAALPGATYAPCDILDIDAVREQARGCEAIIHLAAIPSPTLAPAPRVFDINVRGTYNVYEAAALEGIRRVVQASSINAIGCAYNLTDVKPTYFPIDEDFPPYTTDVYSLSKQLIEEIGAYYWRREGISGAAFRFPWVYGAGMIQHERFQHRVQVLGAAVDALLALPADERAAKLADARTRALALRASRPFEHPNQSPMTDPRLTEDDPLLWLYVFDRFNFWVFIDERDAAQALEKAVLADYEGAHPLFANDDRSWMPNDSRTLAELFFPDVTEWREPPQGNTALVSIARARNLIGFAPQHSIGTL